MALAACNPEQDRNLQTQAHQTEVGVETAFTSVAVTKPCAEARRRQAYCVPGW